MTGLLYGQVFIVFYLYIEILETVSVDVSVQAVSCPTSKNQPVNITRVIDRLGITWYKNNDPISNAIYNPTTGGCLKPSNTEGYTTYCEKVDNSNDTLFTLQVHQPTEGDGYYINGDFVDGGLRELTTIIFQEPERIELKIQPTLQDEVILTNCKILQLTSSIPCTKPTPVFTWIIKSQDGLIIAMTGTSTTNTTGCDVTKTTLTSTVTLSKETVKIINDPFTVSVQLSYKECDNIHTSQPTPYFTIKGGDCVGVGGVTEDRLGVGVGIGIGVSVVIAGVIVGATLVILKMKGRTIALPLTSTKDTGSEPGTQFTNMASFSREASGTTTSGEDGLSSPSHYEDLNSGTRDNTAVTYQQLSNDTSGATTSGVDEPSHYEGLTSETRENTAPTYQQLSVYQN